MNSDKNIVIVGAGLAGLTSAIHLSKFGHQVTIIDKGSFPRHKVCGEYISNEVRQYLEFLGLDIDGLGARKIDTLMFSSNSGKQVVCKLPMAGFGLSRFTMDDELFKIAISQGCEFIEDAVTEVELRDGVFKIKLGSGDEICAAQVLGCYGKRSNLDLNLDRPFAKKLSPWLGVKMHYKGKIDSNVVGLHNFDGGYCGVSEVENGIVNVCYLADYESFKKFRNPVSYQTEVMSVNPNLKHIFETMQPMFDKAITIGQISFEKKTAVHNHILMVGDAAGLIHPLCGNGMAMAIHSGKIAAELLMDFVDGKIADRETFESEYEKRWTKNFASRLKAGRLLGRLLERRTLSDIVLKLVATSPFFLRQIISRTHGKYISVTE